MTQDPWALIGSGDFASAASLLKARIVQDPAKAADWTALASCMAAMGDDPAAVECARQAVSLDRFQPRALTILGGVLSNYGHWDEAKKHLDLALRLAPDMPSARWNRAHINLAQQNWAEGFADYEYGKVNGHRPVRSTGKEWRGETDPKGTLLLWSEQGLGDTVQFSRFIPAAIERFQGRVIVEWHTPLLRWGQKLFPQCGHYCKTPEGYAPEAFTREASICSLPHILGLTPSQEPYIPRPVEATPGRVGFCWKGSPTNPRDAVRSLTDEQAKAMKGFVNVSLQRGSETPFDMETPSLGDVWQTAKACASCEYVVSVDSAVAHVAASMGVPVYLIGSIDPEWRWGTSGPTSPWYGSVTVFRPSDHGHSFEQTLEAVKAALPSPLVPDPPQASPRRFFVRPLH